MNKKHSFEENLKELETIVNQLENGDCTLEESIELFDRGTKLSRACNQMLEQAQQRIVTLSQAEEQANVDEG